DIARSSAGLSTVGGNLSVINGAGFDSTRVVDINCGGNVAISNGHGDASGNTGYSAIFNQVNTSMRSVIKGNVTVPNLEGNVTSYDGLWDMEIRGNVAFNHGRGNATMYFDGYVTHVPVLIHGNLSLAGSGVQSVSVGLQYNITGVVVGKN